jgi:hypothetical protein
MVLPSSTAKRCWILELTPLTASTPCRRYGDYKVSHGRAASRISKVRAKVEEQATRPAEALCMRRRSPAPGSAARTRSRTPGVTHVAHCDSRSRNSTARIAGSFAWEIKLSRRPIVPKTELRRVTTDAARPAPAAISEAPRANRLSAEHPGSIATRAYQVTPTRPSQGTRPILNGRTRQGG